jgi:hypothetical protein
MPLQRAETGTYGCSRFGGARRAPVLAVEYTKLYEGQRLSIVNYRLLLKIVIAE